MKINVIAELGVLGTLISDGNPSSLQVQKSMLYLDEHLFISVLHEELYKIIRKCYDNNQWFDAASLLGMKLDTDLYDTIRYSISGQYFSSSMLDNQIYELKRLSLLREQIKILESSLRACNAESIPSLAAEILMNGIQKAGNIGVNEKIKDGHTFADIHADYLAGNFKDGGEVKCGIQQFGKINNGGLITIAGASGVGKTFFSLYVMDQLIKHQPEKQFLFFSLEMKRNQIWDRYLCIKHDKALEQLSEADRSLSLADGKVFDQPKLDIDYIDTISRLQAMAKPISVIVVDYIGLVSTRKRHEREDLKISDITQTLSALAMDLNCLVIGLSQTNRDASKRTKDDRCPYPSDVADSSGSVRSASLWVGIDRPELYDDSPDRKNLFVAKCRKTRHGTNFEAYFHFNGGRFKESSKPFLVGSTPKSFKNSLNSNIDILNNQAGEF